MQCRSVQSVRVPQLPLAGHDFPGRELECIPLAYRAMAVRSQHLSYNEAPHAVSRCRSPQQACRLPALAHIRIHRMDPCRYRASRTLNHWQILYFHLAPPGTQICRLLDPCCCPTLLPAAVVSPLSSTAPPPAAPPACPWQVSLSLLTSC